MSRLRRFDFWSGVLALAFVVVAVLMVWPLYGIFTASVIDNRSGAWTLANFAQILGHPAYRAALVNSLIVGTGGMFGAMLLGIPLAVLTTRYVIAGRGVLATLAVLALVSPPFIGAYAWIMMLGSNGWMRAMLADWGIGLPPIYGLFGILLAFSLKFYPFVFLLTASGLGTISPSVEEAAESLGAGPWRRFFTVTLPLVFPALSSGALLAFVLSIADFGTPSIVGGKLRLLATTAFDLFTAEMGGNPGLASATSVVLLAVCMAVVVAQRWAVPVSPSAAQARRAPRTSAHSSSAITRAARGRPSSTASCSGRLWVWSKKATGRRGKGVSDHARLNSPQPTPARPRLELLPLPQCSGSSSA